MTEQSRFYLSSEIDARQCGRDVRWAAATGNKRSPSVDRRVAGRAIDTASGVGTWSIIHISYQLELLGKIRMFGTVRLARSPN